ncbi:CBS domain-containing protein [bacterium]|nr:CBS domain-containing protein [bacterium]
MELKELTAKDIMTESVVTCHADQSLNLVELTSEAKHVRHIPVVGDEDEPLGMLSVRDILKHFAAPSPNHFIPIKELMVKRVVTCTPTTALLDVARQLVDSQVSSVMVVDENKVVGIVTEHDFVLALLGKKPG